MLNALVGLTRLESQVNHTLHNVNDPLANARRELILRQKIEQTADTLTAGLREEALDIEV
jgi:hypothetical protein